LAKFEITYEQIEAFHYLALETKVWAVGYTCDENANFKDPLKLKKHKASFVAKVTVYGPYDKLAETYPAIEQSILKDGYDIIFWSLEKYLDDPRSVKPEDLRTEIYIDVKKSD
jgi:effector-binding domain-containing protein